MKVDLAGEYAQWLYYYAYCYYSAMFLSFVLELFILKGAIKAKKKINKNIWLFLGITFLLFRVQFIQLCK